MENRHGDTPVINDYTYYVFEQIEARGLQFALPEAWRPLYVAFLRDRKRRREEAASAIASALLGIAKAFETTCGTKPTRYSESFGYRGTETPQADSKANTAAGPLEE
jgi:hypothetical protein